MTERENETVVIVGGGLAGHATAETLRREGFDGNVILFSEEPDRPYDRPPLSKEFLKGEWDKHRLYYKSETAYAEQRIELRLNTRVEGLDTEARLVFVAGSEPVHYDNLLIATGGYPRRLAIPGADLPGVHYLRTIEDAVALGKLLRPGSRLAVVGAGFIGCEVAAAARTLGAEVTVLEPLSHPMANVFGPEIGQFYAAEHRARGVELLLGEGASEFIGEKRVEAVASTKGNIFNCAAVVIGVGLTPAVEFIKNTPIAVANGILVDEYCRTSVPHVYAAGDVANRWDPRLQQRVRVEHWDNAALQAETAARNILGKEEAYIPIPYFWSDQYDLKLQLFGCIPKNRAIETVMRGSYEQRAFNIFYLVDRRLAAVVGVNRPKDTRAATRLIENGKEVPSALLADSSVNLLSLESSRLC